MGNLDRGEARSGGRKGQCATWNRREARLEGRKGDARGRKGQRAISDRGGARSGMERPGGNLD